MPFYTVKYTLKTIIYISLHQTHIFCSDLSRILEFFLFQKYDIFVMCSWVATRWQQYGTYLHTRTRTHTRARARARTHTHKRAHTHTHKHTRAHAIHRKTQKYFYFCLHIVRFITSDPQIFSRFFLVYRLFISLTRSLIKQNDFASITGVMGGGVDHSVFKTTALRQLLMKKQCYLKETLTNSPLSQSLKEL